MKLPLFWSFSAEDGESPWGSQEDIIIIFIEFWTRKEVDMAHKKVNNGTSKRSAGTFFRSDSTDQAFICFLPWIHRLSPAHDDDWSTCVAVSLGKSAPRRRHARYPQLLSPDIERTKKGPVKDQQDRTPFPLPPLPYPMWLEGSVVSAERTLLPFCFSSICLPLGLTDRSGQRRDARPTDCGDSRDHSPPTGEVSLLFLSSSSSSQSPPPFYIPHWTIVGGWFLKDESEEMTKKKRQEIKKSFYLPIIA